MICAECKTMPYTLTHFAIRIFFLLFSNFIFTSLIVSSQNHHPLDPLNPSEFLKIKSIVQKSYPKYNVSFHYVGIDEPEKHAILSWQYSSTKIPPRRAFVITRLNKQTHEIVVDLSTQFIISDKIYNGHGYPILTLEEQSDALVLPYRYPPFIHSIEKRSLNISQVVCPTFSVGWFGEEKKSKRVLKLRCFYLNNETVNGFLRPLEGIVFVVDLDEMKIVEYHDRFIVPVPKAEGTEYQASRLRPPFGPNLNGARIVLSDGPGFKIDGHIVR